MFQKLQFIIVRRQGAAWHKKTNMKQSTQFKDAT